MSIVCRPSGLWTRHCQPDGRWVPVAFWVGSHHKRHSSYTTGCHRVPSWACDVRSAGREGGADGSTLAPCRPHVRWPGSAMGWQHRLPSSSTCPHRLLTQSSCHAKGRDLDRWIWVWTPRRRRWACRGSSSPERWRRAGSPSGGSGAATWDRRCKKGGAPSRPVAIRATPFSCPRRTGRNAVITVGTAIATTDDGRCPIAGRLARSWQRRGRQRPTSDGPRAR